MKKASTSSLPRTTKISYDSVAKALYIRVSRNKVFKTKAITNSFIVDIDKKGKLVGVEILNTTQNTKKEALKSWLDFDTAQLALS